MRSTSAPKLVNVGSSAAAPRRSRPTHPRWGPDETDVRSLVFSLDPIFCRSVVGAPDRGAKGEAEIRPGGPTLPPVLGELFHVSGDVGSDLLLISGGVWSSAPPCLTFLRADLDTMSRLLKEGERRVLRSITLSRAEIWAERHTASCLSLISVRLALRSSRPLWAATGAIDRPSGSWSSRPS